MITFLFHFIVGYFFWELLLSRLRPRYVSLGGIENHHIGEVQIRLVTLCHAYLCVTSLIMYLVGVIPTTVFYWSRIHSTAFFIFDLIRSTMIRERLNHLGQGKLLKTDPMVTLVHHITTILLMFGAGFGGSHSGLVLFYLAEIPMIFLLTTWYQIYNNQENTVTCALFRVLEVITYGIIRVVFVPLFFLVVMLPQMSTGVVSKLMMLFYLVVYIQVVFSFVHVSKLNWKSLRKFIKDNVPQSFLSSSLS